MIRRSLDEARARRLALDIELRASRHKRATDEAEYLKDDLESIEEKADELERLLRGQKLPEEPFERNVEGAMGHDLGRRVAVLDTGFELTESTYHADALLLFDPQGEYVDAISKTTTLAGLLKLIDRIEGRWPT